MVFEYFVSINILTFTLRSMSPGGLPVKACPNVKRQLNA